MKFLSKKDFYNASAAALAVLGAAISGLGHKANSEAAPNYVIGAIMGVSTIGVAVALRVMARRVERKIAAQAAIDAELSAQSDFESRKSELGERIAKVAGQLRTRADEASLEGKQLKTSAQALTRLGVWIAASGMLAGAVALTISILNGPTPWSTLPIASLTALSLALAMGLLRHVAKIQASQISLLQTANSYRDLILALDLSLDPKPCKACGGSGFHEYEDGDRMQCDSCFGDGFFEPNYKPQPRRCKMCEGEGYYWEQERRTPCARCDGYGTKLPRPDPMTSYALQQRILDSVLGAPGSAPSNDNDDDDAMKVVLQSVLSQVASLSKAAKSSTGQPGQGGSEPSSDQGEETQSSSA